MTPRKRLNSLKVGEFISKEGLFTDPLWTESNIARLRKELKPKEFKTVSKHLVRIK